MAKLPECRRQDPPMGTARLPPDHHPCILEDPPPLFLNWLDDSLEKWNCQRQWYVSSLDSLSLLRTTCADMLRLPRNILNVGEPRPTWKRTFVPRLPAFSPQHVDKHHEKLSTPLDF